MKLYVFMCSLSLLAGAAIGHLNGKYTAASHFVTDCVDSSLVVFRDEENDTKRRFHCFEIQASEADRAKETEAIAPAKFI